MGGPSVTGTEETRFRTALSGADDVRIYGGANDWQNCSRLLAEVSAALRKAAAVGQELGGQSGQGLQGKFTRASGRVERRSRELQLGNRALNDASNVITEARTALEKMDREHNAPEPAPYVPTPRWQLQTDEEVRDEKDRASAHQAQQAAYAADQAARERISKRWADKMDQVFADSAGVMKQIHGLEPESPGGPGQPLTPGGPGTRLPARAPLQDGPGGGPGGSAGDDGHDGGSDPDDGGTGHGEAGDHGGSGEDDGPGAHGSDGPGHQHSGDQDGDEDGVTPIGTQVLTSDGSGGGGPGPGTLGGLAVGGAGGGALVAGIRGLVVPGTVSSAGVRPIGSTSRSAVPGALGRSSVAPGSPVTRATGGTGAARGTGTARGGRGTPGVGQAGSRGGRATGGRGGTGRAAAGGIDTGRTRAGRSEDEEKRTRRDLFDDGSDWLDDEDAAPDVLD